MTVKGGKCWPAASRKRSAWQVAARGTAGHASNGHTWRQWMEPVRPNPTGGIARDETWQDAARRARKRED